MPSIEFYWCMIGALTGIILNVRSPMYIGVREVLDKYSIDANNWIVFGLDLIFFCFLGPIIMIAMYHPGEIYQAISLGIGWPFVIQGQGCSVLDTLRVRRRLNEAAIAAGQRADLAWRWREKPPA